MSSQYTAKDSASTVLSTELNSLGDGSNKITGTALSNDASGERDLFADFSLSLAAQGSARDSGATVDIYIIPEVDTTYAYGGDSLDPSANHYRGSFRFDAATTARVDILDGVRLPNSDYHVLLQNNTGQAFAASGNVLKSEIYPGYEDV
jgi:hypothetical protein